MSVLGWGHVFRGFGEEGLAALLSRTGHGRWGQMRLLGMGIHPLSITVSIMLI